MLSVAVAFPGMEWLPAVLVVLVGGAATSVIAFFGAWSRKPWAFGFAIIGLIAALLNPVLLYALNNWNWPTFSWPWDIPRVGVYFGTFLLSVGAMIRGRRTMEVGRSV